MKIWNWMMNLNLYLKMISRANEIFRSSQVEEKQEFLKFILEDLTLNGKKLSISLQEPYNLIFEHASRSQWLPLVDLFRTRKAGSEGIVVPEKYLKVA